MKLSEFYKTEYRVCYINCLRQYWRYEKEWSCLGEPKERNIFLYLDGCSARYTLASGESFTAREGAVVFCPTGSEYKVEFFDFLREGAGTVGINFHLFSDSPLPDTVEVFETPPVHLRLSEIEAMDGRGEPVVMKYNVAITEILTSLGELSDKNRDVTEVALLAEGIEYLCSHLCEDVPIGTLAALCNMSEVYFRRLFKRELGASPVKYRLNRRLERAAEYLRYTTSPVSEIAEQLGFSDSSYFIKRFKEKYSVTPLDYRQKL